MKNLKSSLLVLSCLYFTAANAQEIKLAQMEPLEKVNTSTTAYRDGESEGDARSPWRMSYFGLASTRTKSFDYASPAVGSYNYLGVAYRISKDTKLSARLAFIQNFAGTNERGQDQKQETYLSDAHIVYSDYDLMTLGPIEVSASFKFYFPTSESSQATHMIGKFRPEMYWKWSYGGYSSVTYIMKPDYYFQRQTAYIGNNAKFNDDGSYVFDPRSTNKIATIEHYLEWDISMNKYYSILPSAGFADEWFYGSEVEGLAGGHDTKSRVALGVKVRPTRGLDFTLSLQNNASLTGQYPVRLGHPDDNQLVLLTNAGLSSLF